MYINFESKFKSLNAELNNYIDARVYLKNTYGWNTWETGQKFYENWLENGEISILKKEPDFLNSKKIEKTIYDEIKLNGRVLDVGGGVGTLRDFLKKGTEYLCIDPHYKSLEKIPLKKIKAYKCLKEKFNYIIGFAEFLPIKDNCFDVVHMRSMLDHVQIPDLVILEANRVLTKEGKLVIGLSVEGGKFGKFNFKFIADMNKKLAKHNMPLWEQVDPTDDVRALSQWLAEVWTSKFPMLDELLACLGNVSAIPNLPPVSLNPDELIGL